MNSYESIFICPVDTTEQVISEISEKIKKIVVKDKGEVLSFDIWGRRRLAYPIHQHKEGIYVCWTFSTLGSVVKNLTQFYRLSDRIIRYLIVRKPH